MHADPGAGAAVAGHTDGRRVVGWLGGGVAIVAGGTAFALDATGAWPGVALASWIGLVAGVGIGCLAALVVDRQPANLAGWCLLGCAVMLAGAGLLTALAGTTSPAAEGFAILLRCAAVLDVGSTATGVLFLFLFPEGRAPTGRWHPLWWAVRAVITAAMVGFAVSVWWVDGPTLAAALVATGTVAAPPATTAAMVAQSLAAVLYGGWLVGGAYLLAMLHGARGTLRRQLRWAATGLIGTTMLLVGGNLFQGWPIQAVAPVPFYVGAYVAMRRYGLWDVQRFVRRAILYAALTVCLAGTYATVVLILSIAVAPVTASSPMAVAAATLTAAAVFAPLRRRLQSSVDQRFDRRTWQAVQAVEAFTSQLRAGDRQPSELDAALRAALGEPTLAVHFLGPDDGLVDRDGALVDAAPSAGRVRRVVATGGRDVAVVDLPEAFAAEHPRLLMAVLTAAAIPMENAALHARAASQVTELRASRARLVEAADGERRRIERDLHDGAQQRLVALALRLRLAQRRLAVREPAEAALLAGAVADLREAVDELRDLTRGLLPPVLAEEGLGVALGALAARIPVPLSLDVSPERFPPHVETTAWFVSCEGLSNAVKHARAGTLGLAVRRDGGAVRVEVTDDGRGGATPTPGGGLQGIADRIAAVGGRFSIQTAPGSGTTLIAELPCAS